MSPEQLQFVIPIVAILAVFGFPVVLVYLWKYFKLKDKELQIDAELRRTSGQALEQRVQRLESIILALDSDLRAKLGAADAAQANAPAREADRASLMQPPAREEGVQPGPDLLPAGKVR